MAASSLRRATLPRDLIDEIEQELATARATIASDRARAAALEDLHALALALAVTQGRPTTAYDLLRAGPSATERERRRRLLRLLRTTIPQS